MLQAFTKHSIQISVNIIEKFPSEIDLSVKLKFKSLTEKLSLNKITHKLKKLLEIILYLGLDYIYHHINQLKKK